MTLNAVSLILETSGRAGRVGVAIGETVMSRAQLDEARRHARDLASTVERLLTEVGQSPRSLTHVYVSQGPGSFTGLRVGIASAKALAYATDCALIAVPTFTAIAHQAPFETVDVISDGLQQHVYCQRFQSGLAVSDVTIRPVADWIATLSPGIAITGPAVSLFDALIPADCPRVPEELRIASIDSLFAIGQSIAPVTRDELFALEPLYLRGSSAEEKAKQTSLSV